MQQPAALKLFPRLPAKTERVAGRDSPARPRWKLAGRWRAASWRDDQCIENMNGVGLNF